MNVFTYISDFLYKRIPPFKRDKEKLNGFLLCYRPLVIILDHTRLGRTDNFSITLSRWKKKNEKKCVSCRYKIMSATTRNMSSLCDMLYVFCHSRC